MKHIIQLSLVAGIALAGGCANTEESDPVAQAPTMTQNKFANAPGWVLNPSMEGGLSAVGSAIESKAGMSFQRTKALANGRDELARQMSLEVSNMFKSFLQSTGVGDAETIDSVSSAVSKQVAQATLSGSRQGQMWVAPDGELYVLVVMDMEAFKLATEQAYKQAVQTSMGNDEALYQQFLGERAQDDLSAEIERRFGK